MASTAEKDKIILSINAGSSSVKVSVFATPGPAAHHGKQSDGVDGGGGSPRQLAEISISGLTSPPCRVKYTRGNGDTVLDNEEIKSKKKAGVEVNDQQSAFRYILDTLIDDEGLREIQGAGDVDVACHRVVHGGEYTAPRLITEETYHHLEELTDLAPLHNGSSLAIVGVCMSGDADGHVVGKEKEGGGGGGGEEKGKLLPNAKNVAVFDSQFHASLPEHVRTYPIDQEVAKKNGLRKYGFHGISYQFITESVAGHLGKRVEETSIIALHLGSGASACAVREGKSWDTSMGLTPVAGLPGATRSGSLDPSLVFHYASDVGKLSPSSTKELHISRAEEILNKESGWKALTGTTDFGVIAGSDESKHKLAFDLFVDRICGYVGAYYVALQGKVDALVFAGGIGEKSDRLRREVVERCSCLGFAVDESKNGKKIGAEVVVDVSQENARHKTLVCQTDEQLQMAKQCIGMEGLWK